MHSAFDKHKKTTSSNEAHFHLHDDDLDYESEIKYLAILN